MCRPRFGALRALARAALAALWTRSNTDKQERALYRQAVGALPARQREIFLLHRVEDLSLAEIARRLDMPVRDVEREFAQALLAIARALEPRP